LRLCGPFLLRRNSAMLRPLNLYRRAGLFPLEPWRIESINRLSILGSRIMLWGTVAGAAIWISYFLIHGNAGLLDLVFLVGSPLLIGGLLRIIAGLSSRRRKSRRSREPVAVEDPERNSAMLQPHRILSDASWPLVARIFWAVFVCFPCWGINLSTEGGGE
jgi:hypothetical protein